MMEKMKKKKMKMQKNKQELFVVDNDGAGEQKGTRDACIWYGLRSLRKYVIVDCRWSMYVCVVMQ